MRPAILPSPVCRHSCHSVPLCAFRQRHIARRPLSAAHSSSLGAGCSPAALPPWRNSICRRVCGSNQLRAVRRSAHQQQQQQPQHSSEVRCCGERVALSLAVLSRRLSSCKLDDSGTLSLCGAMLARQESERLLPPDDEEPPEAATFGRCGPRSCP